MGFPNRSTRALRMLLLLMPPDVSRNFMIPLAFQFDGSRKAPPVPLVETEAERLKTHNDCVSHNAESSALAVSLAHKGLPLPHYMQDILPSRPRTKLLLSCSSCSPTSWK